MKRLTVIFPDDWKLQDVEDILANAIEFHLERLPDPPSVLTKPKKRIGTVHRQKGMSTEKAIAQHYTPEGMFKKELAQKWITDEGYSSTSTSPAISVLKQRGVVEEISPQKYRFVKPLA